MNGIESEIPLFLRALCFFLAAYTVFVQHKPPMRNFFPLPSPPIANLGRLLERWALYFYLLKRKVIEAAHSGKLILGKGKSMKNLTKGVVVINRWWGEVGGI